MPNAYERKQQFSPDGKRPLQTETSIGDSVVLGVVALGLLAAIVLLVLTGHATIAAPLSFGGLLGGLGSLFRR